MTREMKAATVGVCAIAEADEAVMRQRVAVAVRMLRLVGSGRALSGSVIRIVGKK